MSSSSDISFDDAYTKSAIGAYQSFQEIAEAGIPFYVKLFLNFEPQDTIINDEHKFTHFRAVSMVDCYHLHDYLEAEELDDIARTRAYDPVVNAIVSFALEWRIESRRSFGRMYPQYEPFMNALTEFVKYEDGAYVYNRRFEGRNVPYCKCAFKLIKSAVAHRSERLYAVPQPQQPFQLSAHLTGKFVNHLHEMYKMLSDESMTDAMMRGFERQAPIPYDIQKLVGSYDKLKQNAKIKFITGQACAGKTTLLNKLADEGWIIMSRGDLGSFSGKADNPVAVACLHASTEWVMSHTNVLGDRSSIDNPLWVGIMQLCDPKYRVELVWELLKFLNANLNAPSIAYYIQQRGVIFIDPYPSLCEARMLARNTGGDSFRSRIGRYAIVQAMAYYTVARLFGWSVFLVPYRHREFYPKAYGRISRLLITDQYFGQPRYENPLPSAYYARPMNNFVSNMEYPKAVGIFK